MKILVQLLLASLLLTASSTANAQLLDRLRKKKDKTENASETTKETKATSAKADTKADAVVADSTKAEAEKGEELKPAKGDDKPADINGRHFTYRCYTLNTDVDKATINACLEKYGQTPLTEMQYYEQGEDVRFKEKNNAAVTLQFKDDTPRLTVINVEDIEDINFVHQLQEIVLSQMGDPTMGYELMKNYDGPAGSVWADYSTYEYMYRYVIGTNVYDFKVTQFGAKMKNGKMIHPYNFSATINKKSEVALKVSENLGDDNDTSDENNPDGTKKKEKKKKKLTEEEKLKKDFYPLVGVSQVGDYSVEARMLRAW